MWVLGASGRTGEAVETMRLAEANDPLSSEVQLNLGWMLILSGATTKPEGIATGWCQTTR